MRSFRSLPLVALFALPCSAQQHAMFDAPLVVGNTQSRFVDTLDFDGDGWSDVVGWYAPLTSWNYMKGWRNDGTGKLVDAGWWIAFPYRALAIEPHDATASGDLDGDGLEDFLFTNHDELRVYRSNGAAPPTLAILHHGAALGGVALADFDQDGGLELAFVDSGVLEIREIDLALGALVPLSQIPVGAAGVGRIVAAELTGDGNPDLLLDGRLVCPVLGGQLQAPTSYAAGWPADAQISFRHDVGDIDNDGDLDAVTFRVAPAGSGQPAEYRVLRRTGRAGFVAEAPRLGGPARRLFDVDADGDLDGVCCGGGGPPPPNVTLSNFRLAWNDGTGGFAPSIDIPSIGSTAIAGVEDLDHDGDLDLVAGRCVYYAAKGPITDSPFTPVGNRLQNDRTICDYDGDGDPDFGLSLEGVHANLGDGSQVRRFHALPPELPGLPRAGSGACGDWDGDGDVDLLAHLGTQAVPLGLELLRNVGCGVYESAGVVADATGLAEYPLGIEDSLAADLDGDGDLDLVKRTRGAWGGTTAPQWLRSAWWRNEGPAGFVFAADLGELVLLHVADFDADGRPDLLSVPAWWSPGSFIYKLQIAKGLGAGTFAAWSVVSGTASRPYPPGHQVVVLDLDLDGDLDIASAVMTSETTGLRGKVHLNAGNGVVFTTPTQPSIDLAFSYERPGAVAAADLDLDGGIDLVFGSVLTAPNAAAILLRKPDNSGWQDPIEQVMFSTMPGVIDWNSWLTPRDPDGDRDIDLVTDRRVENLLYMQPDGGSRVQLEGGNAGAGPIVPTLGAVGPFRVGVHGSLRLRGARPGASGILSTRWAASLPASFGGLTVSAHVAELESFVASGSPADPAGSGAWSKSFVVTAAEAGRTKVHEAFLQDLDATGGEARSNQLVLTFGP